LFNARITLTFYFIASDISLLADTTVSTTVECPRRRDEDEDGGVAREVNALELCCDFDMEKDEDKREEEGDCSSICCLFLERQDDIKDDVSSPQESASNVVVVVAELSYLPAFKSRFSKYLRFEICHSSSMRDVVWR
jgi:hypothetical protein